MSSILGRGWEYPIQYEQGKFAQRGDALSVRAAVFYVLSTRVGSRFMRPKFGSMLYTLLFDGLTDETIQLAEVFAEDAIRQWVPRVQSVRCRGRINSANDHQLDLFIECRLIDSSVPEAFIYPFYVQGGIQ